jgi:glucosyl-3-phosphoglycerate synthase
VPVLAGTPAGDLLSLSQALQGGRRILVQGVVPVQAPGSLSQAAGDARALRASLQREFGQAEVRVRGKILVSLNPGPEVAAQIGEQRVELLLTHWPRQPSAVRESVQSILAHARCDAAALAGPLPAPGGRVLAVLRGGPDSELALRLALQLAASLDLQVTTMLLPLQPTAAPLDGVQQALDQVLEHLPEVVERRPPADDSALAILEQARGYDLLAIGASPGAGAPHPPADPLATHLLESAPGSMLLARARPPAGPDTADELPGAETISILVDKWFAENTFHADEFDDLLRLVALKQEQGLTISLALPALNEEQTVGKVIRTLQRALQRKAPLLDEIVLMDSDSTDRTRRIAESLGLPVYIHQQVLPQHGGRPGKGEALWKSLYVTRGDLILWIDTDIVNIHPRFVYGLLGPLLTRRDLMLTKGFYLRPIRVGRSVQAGGGGRVTELTARPLLNLFYPALSGLIQPLSGEYAGRRRALEQLPFSSGYGVEIGLLIDVLEQFGLGAIGQVDLEERIHHNQPLTALSRMSFAIIQTLTRKLDRRYGLELLKDINRSMKIIRHRGQRFYLEVERIAERERPPMVTLPEYQQRFGRGGPA